METYVSAQYKYLVLPIGLIILTLVFLITTIVRSRMIEVWKSSNLAVLSGLDKETREALGNFTSVASLKERAMDIKVVLRKDENGWKIGEAC